MERYGRRRHGDIVTVPVGGEINQQIWEIIY
jgi:hypothetical protein